MRNLTLFNISLLCKWWWKLEREEGLWQTIVRNKYLRQGGIFHIKHKQVDSASWHDLLKIKQLYLLGRCMVIGDGRRTDFWGDAWCGHTPLSQLFPSLHAISNDLGCTVRELADRRWNFSFKRWLDEHNQRCLVELGDKLMGVRFNQDRDKPVWKWEKSDKFSVKSIYTHLSSNGIDRSFKHLWKAKIPLKIKIWLWLIWHNAIATKDNMKKRQWEGDTKCRFCHEKETIGHLFFTCSAAAYVWGTVTNTLGATTRPGCFSQYFWWITQHSAFSRNVQIAGLAAICWAIWKIHNRACFEGKLIRSLVELICTACSFLTHWAGIHNETDGAMLRSASAGLQEEALRVHQVYARNTRRRLEDDAHADTVRPDGD